MKKICGIYKITSPSGKIYIGQSNNIKNRVSFYKNHLCKQQQKIYYSILKYGWNAHVFEIIRECDETELDNLEQHYIKLFDTFNTKHGMNLTSGGKSCKLSNETKNKIRISSINRIVSEKTRNKMRDARQGIKLSDETKKRIGDGSRHNKYCLGRVLSDGTKQKIGEKNSGSYEVYDNENVMIAKFSGNLKIILKQLKLPRNSLTNTYRKNKKIVRGKHAGWYMIKLL